MLATKVHEVFTITEKALPGIGVPNSNLLVVVVMPVTVQYSAGIVS